MRRAEGLAGVALALCLAAGAAHAASEKKPSAVESYVKLPTLTASILRPEGGRGVLTLDCGLDVADPKLRERAELSKPRLVDAFSAVLRRYGASLPPGRAPDLDIVGRQLQAAADKVIGRPGARFLFGAVLVN